MNQVNGAPASAGTVAVESWAWREQLARRIAPWFLAVYAPAAVLFWFTLAGRWQREILVVTAGLCALLLAPSVLFGRPTGRPRAWLIVVPACSSALVGFVMVGFLSGPAVVLSMTLMLSGLLLGRGALLGLAAASALALAAIAWGMVHGHLPPPAASDVAITNARTWIRTLVVIFLGNALFGTMLTSLVNRLTESFIRLSDEIGRREKAERARTEAELAGLEAKQLEAIGRLAAGVAHDFNNNLTAIIGNAELLKLDLAPGGDQSVLADEILIVAKQAAELTRQLLVSSRRSEMTQTPIDLHALVTDTVNLFRRSTDPRVVVVLALEAERTTVSGDHTLLQSAVLNLLLNARDAMSNGGTVRVSTSRGNGHGDDASAGPPAMVTLTVTDDGSGIASADLPRIFEPFFTTKPAGKGTGLGLAAVAGTVRSMRGRIEVESEVERGTTFRVHLPGSDETPTKELGKPTDDHGPGSSDGVAAALKAFRGEGRILLVDDERAVRQTARNALRAFGYDVTEVGDGEEALAHVSAGRTFDLVLLDLRLPKLSGEETFDRLRELRPGLPVLLWSGYGEEHDVARMLRHGAKAFLQKPCQLAELGRAVATVFGKAAPTAIPTSASCSAS